MKKNVPGLKYGCEPEDKYGYGGPLYDEYGKKRPKEKSNKLESLRQRQLFDKNLRYYNRGGKY